MPLSGFGKQPFRFGGKGKGMEVKKWQLRQVNFTMWILGDRAIGLSGYRVRISFHQSPDHPIAQPPDCPIT